ncbi:hypothetical protein [Emcibacter sp.]|uniref:hypothetical protein n=1 Tax=Emcibacter sp. TaxID=1979954 RepID=UPI002AA6F8FB|nr:hypothetical protein [Emcibacter sp.]
MTKETAGATILETQEPEGRRYYSFAWLMGCGLILSVIAFTSMFISAVRNVGRND